MTMKALGHGGARRCYEDQAHQALRTDLGYGPPGVLGPQAALGAKHRHVPAWPTQYLLYCSSRNHVT